MNYLKFILDQKFYDILFLVETWLSEEVEDKAIVQHSEFTIFRSDRVNKRGGGVGIIIKTSLNPSLIDACEIEGINCLTLRSSDKILY